MAIGDTAASQGLVTWASTQDRRLGYQNDNQRGDDIAKVMIRTSKLESNAKKPTNVYRAKVNGGTVVHGTVAITDAITIPAVPYARTLRVSFAAAVTTLGAQPGEVTVRTGTGATVYRGAKVAAAPQTASVEYNDSIAANATATYRLYASSDATIAVSGDNTFTWLEVESREIS